MVLDKNYLDNLLKGGGGMTFQKFSYFFFLGGGGGTKNFAREGG